MSVHITPNLEISQAFCAFAFSLVNLMCGFMKPRPTIPAGWIWLYWSDPAAYVLYGLVGSQLGDVDTLTAIPSAGPVPTEVPVNAFVQDYFGFDSGFVVRLVRCFLPPGARRMPSCMRGTLAGGAGSWMRGAAQQCGLTCARAACPPNQCRAGACWCWWASSASSAASRCWPSTGSTSRAAERAAVGSAATAVVGSGATARAAAEPLPPLEAGRRCARPPSSGAHHAPARADPQYE